MRKGSSGSVCVCDHFGPHGSENAIPHSPRTPWALAGAYAAIEHTCHTCFPGSRRSLPTEVSSKTKTLQMVTLQVKTQLLFCQEKPSAEIRGKFFQTKSWVNFAGDSLVDFFGPFSLDKRRNKSTPKSTAKFKLEFGSFAAKINTARIWPWFFFSAGKFRRRG